MPLIVNKIATDDPRFEPGKEKYELTGTLDAGNLPGIRIPLVLTLQQALSSLEYTLKLKQAEVARFDKPIAATEEIIAALRAAGA